TRRLHGGGRPDDVGRHGAAAERSEEVMQHARVPTGFVVVAAAACLAIVASSSNAATTPVLSPYPGEASHLQIFNHTYGGGFVASGDGYTNGTITITRVDDNDDQIYDAGTYSARAIAAFSSQFHQFGVL